MQMLRSRVFVIAMCGVVNSAVAQDRNYTEIAGTGQSLYNIAVPPPIGTPALDKEQRTIHSVLAMDLQLIGLFKILNPKGFLANLRAEGVNIEPSAWQSVGAQGVVKVRLDGSADELVAEFYLYEVAKGAQPVLKKTYRGPSKQARYLAHRFGDDMVHYFTGDRGIFNTRIAFAAHGAGRAKSQIVVVDYDGYGPRTVSTTGELNILPAWTPDGQISWTSFLWQNPDLYLGSLNDNKPTRISRYPGLNIGASWSPSGNEVAITLSKDGNSEIYILTREGKIIRRLTDYPGIDTTPTWSPDGRQIAFVSDRAGKPQIFIMPAQGGNARRLTYVGNYNQEPAWCPRKDTPLIAFSARDEKGHYDIFTIHVDSGELKRLTQGQGNNKSPSWAPNGRLVVFASTRGGLWLSGVDGLNQNQILRGAAENPAWSR